MNITNKFNSEKIEILNEDLFEFDASVTEYLDLVDTTEYFNDWCKTVLPDSDEF